MSLQVQNLYLFLRDLSEMTMNNSVWLGLKRRYARKTGAGCCCIPIG